MAANVAFEILYKEYYVRVFRLCQRILSTSVSAEDATQEVFMRAFRHFGTFDSSEPFWPWIASIANHHCIDLLRQHNRTRNLFGDEKTEMENLSSADMPVLADLIDGENAGTLRRAIARLPDKYRVPIVLAYFNDSSYEEIASELSISRSHVGVLLLRAKQRLRAQLNTSGADRT